MGGSPDTQALRGRWRLATDVGECLADLQNEAPPAGPERADYLFELADLGQEVWWDREWTLGAYLASWEAEPRRAAPLTRALALALEIRHVDRAVEVATLELRQAPDEARRHELRVLLGTLLLDLGRRDEASPILSSALLAAPDDEGIQVLAAICHDSLDWSEEVVRLVARAARSPKAPARALCLRAARILRLERPGGPAYEQLLRRALAADPVEQSALYLYEELLAGEERWDELETFHQTWAMSAPTASERARRLLGLAWRWRHGFADSVRSAAFAVRALTTWQREGGELPSAPAGLALVAQPWGDRGEWAGICAFVDALLDPQEGALPLAPDAELEAARIAGWVAWQRLADSPRAAAYLERVRRLAPGNGLARHFGCHNPPAALEAVASQTIGEAQAALMEAARALETDPNPERAIEAWRKAVAADPGKRRPRRELARVLRRAGRWNALVEALRDEAHGVRTDDERAALAFETADVYGAGLGLEAMALTSLKGILDLPTLSPAALDELQEIHQRAGRWSELARVLARKVALAAGDADRASLGLALARVFSDHLRADAQAMTALEEVLAIDPDQGEALERLSRIYEQKHAWDKLMALRRRALAGAADPAARMAGALEVARLATKVRKAELKSEAWRDVLALDPGHAEALAELEKIYERQGDHVALAEILERRAATLADAGMATTLLVRAAQLHGDQGPRAIRAWRAVLDRSPDNMRALDALKRLYVAERGWEELETLFVMRGRLDEYARILERQISLEERAGRVELGLRLATYLIHVMARPERARLALERVLEADPAQPDAIRRLIPLYEGAQEERKLARVLALELDLVTEPAARVKRAVRLAELHEHKLLDRPAALRWWLSALGDDPGDERAWSHGERLATALDGWRDLCDTVRRAAARLAPEAAAQLRERLAVLEERELYDLDAAAASWAALLETDPTHKRALDALERLYGALRRPAALLDVLGRRLAAAATDPEEQSRVRHRLLKLCEELGDDDGAVRACEGILATEEDADALRVLAGVYERREDAPRLVPILERRLALAGGPQNDAPAARLPLLLQLGQVIEEQLGDPARAFQHFRAAMEIDAASEPARLAVARRLADPDSRLAAAALLEPMFIATNDERLVQVWTLLADGETDPARRVERLLRLGELQARAPGGDGAAAAFQSYARALREDPTHAVALERLEKVADLSRSWNELAALYRELAGGRHELKTQIDLRCRLGRLYQGPLGETDRAIATFGRILDLDAGNEQAAIGLEALYRKAQRYREAFELRLKQADRVADRAARARALYDAGVLARDHLDEPKQALHCFEQAEDLYLDLATSTVSIQSREFLAVFQAIDALLTADKDWQSLVGRYRRLIARLPKKPGGDMFLMTLWYNLAEIYGARLADPAAAAHASEEAARLQQGANVVAAELDLLSGQDE